MTESPVEILLVEDNVYDAELTLQALRRLSFVESARLVRDGDEALDYVFGRGKYAGRPITEQPRVILLDLRLFEASGLDVLRAIKEDERTRPIPVVMLTASREASDLVDCYRQGANSYIVKPATFDELMQKLRVLSVYWVHVNETPFHPPQPETV